MPFFTESPVKSIACTIIARLGEQCGLAGVDDLLGKAAGGPGAGLELDLGAIHEPAPLAERHAIAHRARRKIGPSVGRSVRPSDAQPAVPA